jgi:hypothetical protein
MAGVEGWRAEATCGRLGGTAQGCLAARALEAKTSPSAAGAGGVLWGVQRCPGSQHPGAHGEPGSVSATPSQNPLRQPTPSPTHTYSLIKFWPLGETHPDTTPHTHTVLSHRLLCVLLSPS